MCDIPLDIPEGTPFSVKSCLTLGRLWTGSALTGGSHGCAKRWRRSLQNLEAAQSSSLFSFRPAGKLRRRVFVPGVRIGVLLLTLGLLHL